MLATIIKGTGNVLEAQSSSSIDTMLANAAAAGYGQDDVDVRQVSKAELDVLIDAASGGDAMRRKVDEERNRRLLAFPFGSKDYDFCDDRGSDVNIAGAGAMALAAIVNGALPGDLRWVDPNVDFSWVAADNTSTLMDAFTMLAFAKAAASWKASHIRCARAIKDASPIPADYASDHRWA